MSLKEIYGINSEPIRDRSWVFPFGKHKGTTLEEVITHDPSYIEWAQANTSLDFHSDIMDELEESEQWKQLEDFPDGYGALDYLWK